jgi:hypothetical protein
MGADRGLFSREDAEEQTDTSHQQQNQTPIRVRFPTGEIKINLPSFHP